MTYSFQRFLNSVDASYVLTFMLVSVFLHHYTLCFSFGISVHGQVNINCTRNNTLGIVGSEKSI